MKIWSSVWSSSPSWRYCWYAWKLTSSSEVTGMTVTIKKNHLLSPKIAWNAYTDAICAVTTTQKRWNKSTNTHNALRFEEKSNVSVNMKCENSLVKILFLFTHRRHSPLGPQSCIKLQSNIVSQLITILAIMLRFRWTRTGNNENDM